jgi:hypothetical protein
VHDDGSVLVAEKGAITKLSADLTTMSTIAGPNTLDATGFADGTGSQARFSQTLNIAFHAGHIYVADTDNNRIRKVTMDGVTTTYAGTGSSVTSEGSLTSADIHRPFSIVVDGATQTMYISAGSTFHLLRKIDMVAETVTAFAGGVAGFADGVGALAKFNLVYSMAFDNFGELIAADGGNHRVRTIATATATVTTLAGSGSAGSTDNANPLLASFNGPTGIAIDGANSVYVTQTGSPKIRKIDGTTGAVTTVAGSGTSGYADGVGCTAQFSSPFGIVLRGGTLFVADTSNHRIRSVVDPSVVPQPTASTSTPCDSINDSCTSLGDKCTILTTRSPRATMCTRTASPSLRHAPSCKLE